MPQASAWGARVCGNAYPAQGKAADIVKRAMLRCWEMDVAGQVHDELLADGDEELPEGLDVSILSWRRRIR